MGTCCTERGKEKKISDVHHFQIDTIKEIQKINETPKIIDSLDKDNISSISIKSSFIKSRTINEIEKKINNNEIIIGDSYILDKSKLLGKGGFGKVFLGINKNTGEKVAIKLESKSLKFSYLLNEYKVYAELSGGIGIPKIFWKGSQENYNILIMELLGPSLENLFIHCDKKFNLATTLKIGIQILNILEFIHNKGYIHGDIKPDCFLIGKEGSYNIYIIDFGLSKKYIDPKTGCHIPFSIGNLFVGNYKFASIHSHLRYEKGRKDDIESLGYMLVYFLNGLLPWQGLKIENHIERNLTIHNMKSTISINNLCLGLPIQIRDFILYSRALKFMDRPDYNYLKSLLIICANNNCIILSEFNFDWITNKHKKEFEKKRFKIIDNEEFSTISSVAQTNIDFDDKSIIEADYIKNKNAFKINKILRTIGPEGLDDKDKKLFEVLTKIINYQKTEKDYLVYRYVDYNYIKNIFNFNPTNDIYRNYIFIRNQIGSIKIEKGFMSCAMTENHVIEREVKLLIKIPKGTNAYITENMEESEIILSHNTKYQILDVNLVKNIIEIYIGILN